MSAVVEADCVEAMRAMDACSVDAVVCDPPYGLEFMGKDWDRLDGGLPQENVWKGRRGGGGSSIGTDDSKPASRHHVALGAGKQHGFRRCQMCGKREFSGSPCECEAPDFALEYRQEAPSSSIRMQRWHEAWAREAYRVLKPGGHLLAFGGTRTYHRLACAVEDAGFEIRDSFLYWGYGSGFPKSLNVERAIAVQTCRLTGRHFATSLPSEDQRKPGDHVCPTTPESEPWSGWGTATKPSYEPIVCARKPLDGTVAATVLRHGTGALNIDACRIDVSDRDRETWERAGGWMEAGYVGEPSTSLKGGADGTLNRADTTRSEDARGRWPANVVLSHTEDCVPVGTRRVKGSPKPYTRSVDAAGGVTGWNAESAGSLVPGYADADGMETVTAWECSPECPVRMLDAQTGTLTSGRESAGGHRRNGDKFRTAYGDFEGTEREQGVLYGDSGGASRFFYCAKASSAERNAGLDGFEAVPKRQDYGDGFNSATKLDPTMHTAEGVAARPLARNPHPTVKPIDLMRWLVRLVTPPGGLVLDPFAGSGTTGIAAALEGFRFIGIEREPEYAEIARARIAWWAKQGAGVSTEAALRAGLGRDVVASSGQSSFDLFDDAA